MVNLFFEQLLYFQPLKRKYENTFLLLVVVFYIAAFIAGILFSILFYTFSIPGLPENYDNISLLFIPLNWTRILCWMCEFYVDCNKSLLSLYFISAWHYLMLNVYWINLLWFLVQSGHSRALFFIQHLMCFYNLK